MDNELITPSPERRLAQSGLALLLLLFSPLLFFTLGCGAPDAVNGAVRQTTETQTDSSEELEAVDLRPPVDDTESQEETAAIGLYETLELVFEASEDPDNPFDTYLLKLQITDPQGETFTIDGFYDGDGQGGQVGRVWKARITPYMEGLWRWQAIPGDASDSSLIGLSGEFSVGASLERGGLVADGRYFRFQTGDPIYLVGNFLDFVDGLRTTHTFMSETTTDAQRNSIIVRHRDFHLANKANIYFANRGDYDSQSVTPWLGSARNNDKSQMDLARWRLYDEYILRFKRNKMFAEMWFFADDSNFGALSEADRNRLLRYGMARTSAFSHTLFVISLEWQEAFTEEEVNAMGQYLQSHNPWQRLVSVHSLQGESWDFAGATWPTFMATQAGNDATPDAVNSYVIGIREDGDLPHLEEEFGFLRNDNDFRLRANLWATFCGGAAGSGTGSGLKALQRFIAESRVPFQRMNLANDLVSGGGYSHYALAERGHHYVVYSAAGGFTLEISGSGLQGYWFNPRDPGATLSQGFSIAAGTHNFVPPDSIEKDWVLWISDGTNLTNGVTHFHSSEYSSYLPLASLSGR